MGGIYGNKSNYKVTILLLTVLALLIGAGVVYWVSQYNNDVSRNIELDVDDYNYINVGKLDNFEGVGTQLGEINILLLGSDSREDNENARSDSLMIAHYNQSTNQIKLASIMRDTFVNIPNYGLHKINTAFSLGGPKLVQETIKDNFDIDLNYYAVVDFTEFPKVVDIIAPDGIEVNIKSTMSHGIEMTLNPGRQTLHGDELLGYVRYRNDGKSDFGRVERQQEILSKLKDEAMSVHNLVKLPEIIDLVGQLVETNVDNKTLVSIGKGLLVSDTGEMETMRIPIDGTFKDKRVKNVGLVLNIDLERNKIALQDFLYGNESFE